MMDRHHCRVDANADVAALAVALDDAEQLDDVTQAMRDGDLGAGDATDPLVVHVARNDLRTEGDRGDDRRLRASVETFDVGGRVALGESEALRFGQGRCVVGVSPAGDRVGHLGEDEVGGAVDDAQHSSDRFAVQALAQRPHDRDATGYCRFEEEVATSCVGGGVELGADVGEQLFVRGDDRLAVGERFEDQLTSRFDSTDRFDDDVDVGIGHHGVGITGEYSISELDITWRRQVAHGHAGDLEAKPGSTFDRGTLRLDELHECGPDVAASEDADPDHLRVARHRVQVTGSGTVGP